MSFISPAGRWPAMPPQAAIGSFEHEIGQLLGRLRDANVRLTLVSIASRLPRDDLAASVQDATASTDPVGFLADGSVGALLLGARPSGPLGDAVVVSRFLQCLMRAPRLRGVSADQAAVQVEAVHRWAGEVDDAQDLIEALSPVQITSVLRIGAS